MADTIVRLIILLLLVATLWLLVRAGRAFVSRQRQLALAAGAPDDLPVLDEAQAATGPAPVRILAFSSAGCRQCHTLQAPALQRLSQARSSEVTVIHVDAVNESDLARRYHILTVPATVVLDAGGQVAAVNYGFAPTRQLSEQVDAALSKSAPAGQRL